MLRGQDSALYLAHYEMRHVADRETPQDTMVENLLLLIGPQSTEWHSYKKLAYGHAYQMEVLEKSNLPVEERVYYRLPTRFVIDETYIFHHEVKHFTLGYLMDRYLFESEYPEQEWQIASDQREILGMVCQRAMTTFRGRDWTAWFAPDVPVDAGPWLLHGLPGLIVSAYDRTGEVSFESTALQSNPANAIAEDPVLAMYMDTVISLPDDPKIFEVKEGEFVKLQRSAQRDIRAFMQARTSRFQDNEFSGSTTWSKVIKNPIALMD